MAAASSMVFTDCSSPTAARLLTRTTPLCRTTTQYGVVFPLRLINPPRSLSIHSSSSSPSQFSSASVVSKLEKSDTKLEIVDKRLDGKKVAEKVRGEVAEEVVRMKEAIGIVPGLAVILVGDRKESATYVSKKKEACENVGFNSFEVHLPEGATEQEVLDAISGFNEDPSVHGILVQLPLPKHMDEQNILNAVSIEKDVDGFHPLNIGCLAMRGREPFFVPCTPKGCIELLHRYDISIKGKRAVVIGRSNIVGMPVALLLQREDATVSIVHSRTKNPEELTKQADIVITAVGQANMVRGSWIKPGAVVIDVGINPVEDKTKRSGFRLVGDVCYTEAKEIASAITPVPGGVGPMTIAMLLTNTLISAKRIHNFQ